MGPKRDKQNKLSERQCLDSGTQDAGKTGVPRPSDIHSFTYAVKCSGNSSESEKTAV